MAEPQQHDETAPDPDEDDLDDLDDVLDEFQSRPPTHKPAPALAPPSTSSNAPSTTAPSASGPGRPTDKHSEVVDPGDEDFTKQLQAGMSSLIGELDSNPDMQKQFEQMMQELIAAGAAPTNHEAGEHLRQAAEAAPKAPADDKPAKGSAKKGDFSDTVRKTMERMQQSGDAATAATSSGGADQSEEDILAQMMKELQNSGGEGGEEDFNKMLMTMMTQLTNKEILYEPMKELHDKFPAWLDKNAATTGKEDLARYREQQSLVGEIVGRFERKGYTDENEGDREYIVERMQKMQTAGSPPPDLVGDMSAAQDALGDLDAGCPQQ
ncbi:hypothetical protein LTR36_008157 [Oleoguttula mirabilis]|uniref:Pex19-domain-containing protein n=1 Tax=Oleoguttula mirabilis TaxID=1507867 RepID=A0AAV9J886_9PEZI|nr:hypothetical protein LTR36_008157 [Oleoguttula mirabilis]